MPHSTTTRFPFSPAHDNHVAGPHIHNPHFVRLAFSKDDTSPFSTTSKFPRTGRKRRPKAKTFFFLASDPNIVLLVHLSFLLPVILSSLQHPALMVSYRFSPQSAPLRVMMALPIVVAKWDAQCTHQQQLMSIMGMPVDECQRQLCIKYAWLNAWLNG